MINEYEVEELNSPYTLLINIHVKSVICNLVYWVHYKVKVQKNCIQIKAISILHYHYTDKESNVGSQYKTLAWFLELKSYAQLVEF